VRHRRPNAAPCLDACHHLPQGTLPSDAATRGFAAGSSGVGGGGAAGGSGVLGGGGLEPTMTIATKDAFAALNKMFKVCGVAVAVTAHDQSALCYNARGHHHPIAISGMHTACRPNCPEQAL
jgi:hypothetical protein